MIVPGFPIGRVSVLIVRVAAVQVGETTHVECAIRTCSREGIAAAVFVEDFAKVVFTDRPRFSAVIRHRDIGTRSVGSGELFDAQLRGARVATGNWSFSGWQAIQRGHGGDDHVVGVFGIDKDDWLACPAIDTSE